MHPKLILSILGTLMFLHVGCSNSLVQYHDTTVYSPEVLGQPQSFTKGKIVSAREVQIKWKDSKKEPDQLVDVVATATEFVIERDIGEPFLFVQFNEEQLKADERILLLKEADKTRIVRDRAAK